MGYDMAKVASRVVARRQEAHSDEFDNVKGQHSRDLDVIISIIFEALLDYRDRSHNGYFVRKFSVGLHDYHLNPITSAPVSDTELLFTPRVISGLADKKLWTDVALVYLEDSHLFSRIRLLDFRNHSTRKAALKLLEKEKTTITTDIREITAQALDRINASAGFHFDERKVAQGEDLKTRLEWLAAGLVSERKESFPHEFSRIFSIRLNIFIVVCLAYEALKAHGEKGSYFHQKLAVIPKRTNAEINHDSTSAESSSVQIEGEPAKKRKKRASKKHDSNVPRRMENSNPESQQIRSEDTESDLEPSFVPQNAAVASRGVQDRQDISRQDQRKLGNANTFTGTATEQDHKTEKGVNTASKGAGSLSVAGKGKNGQTDLLKARKTQRKP